MSFYFINIHTMKTKNFGIIAILAVGILTLTGCGSQKVTTCTLNLTPDEWTKVESVYKMTHDGKYVNLVETIETVESNDQEVLDYYKSYVEEAYEPYKDLEYYDYSIDTTSNSIVSKVTINFEKIDINKYMEINPATSSFISDGKAPLDSLRTVYGMLGATCE